MTAARIDHAAAYVVDLEATRAFYERYLGATSSDRYHNPRTGLTTYFLSFAGDSRLEIISRPELAEAGPAARLGWIHLAFRLGSIEAVDELTARLAEDGHLVLDGPRTTGDGYYESVVQDPEGNRIELVA